MYALPKKKKKKLFLLYFKPQFPTFKKSAVFFFRKPCTIKSYIQANKLQPVHYYIL